MNYSFENYLELNGNGKELWAESAAKRIVELEKAIGEAIYEIETNNAPNELRSALRVSLKILRSVRK